jgi:hypothetical protein
VSKFVHESIVPIVGGLPEGTLSALKRLSVKMWGRLTDNNNFIIKWDVNSVGDAV